MRPSTRSNRGVASIWALVVLSVLTVLLSAITWQLLASRRALERRQHQIQASYLAEAGVERAADRLLAKPAGYAGETIEIIPGSSVRIEVHKDPKETDAYRVQVHARYPQTPSEAVVRTATRRFRRTAENEAVRLEVLHDAAASP